MKSPTPYYRDLRKSINKARKLTRGINMLGCETDLQHLKLQAYVLLCHSAIERYLEELGLNAALRARQVYTSSGVITKTLVALISSKLIDDLPVKGRNRVAFDMSSNIEEFSKEAFSRYRDAIVSNHGIVKKDQINILTPVGVVPECVDLILMNNLHVFGGKRGEFAHDFKVQRTDTLTSVETTITAIIDGIISYDEAVCGALRAKMK